MYYALVKYNVWISGCVIMSVSWKGMRVDREIRYLTSVYISTVRHDAYCKRMGGSSFLS